MSLISKVSITLVSDYMLRPRAEEIFSEQDIELELGKEETSIGVDGRLSSGGSAHCVHWLGGTLECLNEATQVHIATRGGEVIVTGDLSWNKRPEAIAGSVRFWVNPKA